MAETVLFLGHTESDGTLGKAGLEALEGARALTQALAGATLVAGLVGEVTQPAADQIGGCGAQRVLSAQDAAFAVPRYATDAAAAEALIRAAGATLVVAAGTFRWNRTLPGVAQRLNGRADTHITGIAPEGSSVRVHRWYYRQRMEAVLERAHRPWILLVESGVFSAYEGVPLAAAGVEQVAVNVPGDLTRTRLEGYSSPQAGEQTIRPGAAVLFVAGAGWTKKQKDGQPHTDEAATLILDFLKQTQSSLGSSKSLVDLGGEGQSVLPFLSHLNQIGQTGSTPRHPKGLATCCHGEEPHVVGWRFINERRAVNLDATCGWARGKADVLYVADAFAVMREVNRLLASGQE
jgi:electron transfer flavoprotein alpha subunit